MFVKNILLFLLMSSFFSCDSDDNEVIIIIDDTAIYNVVFDSNWTAQIHPTNYPSNAHFSWMVGVTHNEQNLLFAKGLLASDGIESMSETGATELLA